ncbi:hypothetical protein ACFCYN_25090, partial [Gottfriedia sp. NPDC056225]|uniref:hypothetical protein n=1 Tax=Gottfriedia sp. NPDC056225 TaxID=3345751 RepID=UPI0035DE8136
LLMSKVGEGLLNKNFSKIVEAQQILLSSTRKNTSTTKLLYKHYEPEYRFYLIKELLKMRYYYRDIIFGITFILILNLLFFSLSNVYYQIGIIFIILFVIDNILTKLNKYEMDFLKKSLMFKVDLSVFFKMKYICQLILVLIFILISFQIMIEFPISFLLFLILLPLKNLLYNYLENKIMKASIYLIGGITYLLPYIEFIIF